METFSSVEILCNDYDNNSVCVYLRLLDSVTDFFFPPRRFVRYPWRRLPNPFIVLSVLIFLPIKLHVIKYNVVRTIIWFAGLLDLYSFFFSTLTKLPITSYSNTKIVLVLKFYSNVLALNCSQQVSHYYNLSVFKEL